MSTARQYELTAAPGKVESLLGALQNLAAKVRKLPGCEGVDIYQDADQPEVIYFREHWNSRAHQVDAGKSLGKPAFAAVMGCLGQAPSARYLNPVELGNAG